jgi:DNA-binding PadR family transcriptional regulator
VKAGGVAVSKVEVVVLGCLADEPLYGYELLERMRARSMSFWVEVGKASVYHVLQRLEGRGLVHGKAQEGGEGPDRRVYRITKAGRDRLLAGLAERFDELAPYETGAGLALGFIHLLPAAEARRAVEARERSVKDLLDAFADERDRTAGTKGATRVVADAMLARQAALATAELAWLRSFRSTIGKLRR